MIKAIVYTSYTGHTKDYAQMLGKELNLPIFELDKAIEKLETKTEIIYLGWLKASFINGYKKASKYFDIQMLAAVGMSDMEPQRNDVIKLNNINNTPLYLLKGGYEKNKLHGIYKFLMQIMEKILASQIKKKDTLNENDKETLELFKNNKSLVNRNELNTIINDYLTNNL